jgi:hypothetical protein
MKNCITQGSPVPEDLIDVLYDSTALMGDPGALQRQLHEDGYLFLRGVLDQDEILAARAEIFERLAAVGEVKQPASEGLFTGQSQRKEIVGDLGVFWQSVCEGPKLRQVTHGLRLRAVMGEVFGEPAQPHDYLFLRPSPVGRATLLHYDRPFFSRGSDRIHTAWFVLGEVPVTDGPLVVVEGSNRFTDLIEPAVAVDYDSNEAPKVSVPDDPIGLARSRGTRLLTANFEPGDLVVFGMTTLHGTLDNHSPSGRIRLSCDIRYQPTADPMDERYFGPNPGGTTGAGYGELNGAKPLTEPWHTR